MSGAHRTSRLQDIGGAIYSDQAGTYYQQGWYNRRQQVTKNPGTSDAIRSTAVY